MSSRTKPQPLSDSEIRQIAAEIDAGRPPMVWFTAAAVGVPEGRSGKVMSLGDPSEGDFLQVKPTGSKDVLSFGPTEVTLVKPARQGAAATKPEAPAPNSRTANRKDSTVTMSSPVSTTAPASAPVTPSAPRPDAGPGTEAPQQSSASADSAKAAKAAAGSRPARPAASTAGARKSKAAEVTITLSGTAEGEWTLDVVNGKKRAIKGLAVPSSAVSQAAKLLHPEVSEVVDSVLEAVRAAQRARVEQLQAELESARRLLDDLA